MREKRIGIPTSRLYSLDGHDINTPYKRPIQQAFAEAVINMAFTHPELLQEASDAVKDDRTVSGEALKTLRNARPDLIEYIDKRSHDLLHGTAV